MGVDILGIQITVANAAVGVGAPDDGVDDALDLRSEDDGCDPGCQRSYWWPPFGRRRACLPAGLAGARRL